MRIAYVPSAPAAYGGLNSRSAIDRRRLAALIPYWVGLGHEVVPWKAGINCDLVYFVSLAHSLQLARRLASKKRTCALVGGVIEDPFYASYAACLSDDYWELKKVGPYGSGSKGFLRRIRRNLGRLHLVNDPTLSLFKVIRRCDGIITTSEAQAATVRQLNVHAVSIADCMPSTDFKDYHCSYQQQSPVTIVWEGTAWGLQLLELIRPALEAVHAQSTTAIEFLFVAPRKRPQPLFGLTDNLEILSTHYQLPTRWVDWSLETIGETLAGAGIGVAPMPLHNPFYLNKAYSKPLSYMACGLPVVASPIPSYRELIRHNTDGILASTLEEWIQALMLLVASPNLRRQLGLAGEHRLNEYHSEEIVARSFMQVFAESKHLYNMEHGTSSGL